MIRLQLLFRQPMRILSFLFLALGLAVGVASGGEIVLHGGRQQMAFNSTNGAIVRAGGFCSGESGLWQIRFRDGGTLCATNASQFNYQHDAGRNSLQMTFRAPEATVVVAVAGREEGFEFQAVVTPTSSTVLEIALPARLRFAPGQVQRLVAPLDSHLGVGAAFNHAFFEPQPANRPSSWKPKSSGPDGYRKLFGRGLKMGDLRAPPIPVTVTAAGQKWFGEDLSRRLAKTVASANRTSLSNQVDVVLLDSTNGPFFAGSHLGGTGMLWRFGGTLDKNIYQPALEVVGMVVRKAASAPGTRRKLGLVSLLNGPASGAGSEVTVHDWRERFARLAKSERLELVELTSAEQMVAAANGNEFLAILNPLGEWLPIPSQTTLAATVDVIGRYVRAGGNWFEVGGYSFYAALQPERFLNYASAYPQVFSDFLHLDSRASQAALYRIQSLDCAGIFVPGRLAFGGDERGGWCERAFGTFVPAGQTWTTPLVRLALGRSAEEEIQVYCSANGITRTLREKLAPELFAKLRQSVLVKYDGSAAEKLAALDQLPLPTLIHWSDYIKGGFDKEYPDHLPPRPAFGTPETTRAFHDRARALGHLLMPYTNPTWWCDHPRGPSFVDAGDVPLVRGLDGKLVHEQYNANDGWTTTFWHPAVRAANRRTVRQFTEEYPVDILFQDQCGARKWLYDLNPASPTPYAYTAGLLAMIAEDSKTKPLSTEDGWDGVVNAEAQLCGFTLALVPGQRPAWVREMKTIYHPSTWELYPFAQRVALDKVAFCHHDLGKFVMNQTVLSWTLGLGFNMSYRTSARALKEPQQLEWLRWLDRIQKSICARYVGEPVKAFEHEQGSTAAGDDGVIRAKYGPVELLANLSSASRRGLPPYGFRATALGLVASGSDAMSFVSEGDARRVEIWIYALAGRECGVELPAAWSGRVAVTFEGQPVQVATVQSGIIQIQLPTNAVPAGQTPQLWHATISASR